MQGRSVLDEAIAGSEENRGRARSFTPRRPPLGFRNGPALRYVQISHMTIVKTPTSYFACASFVTTAATLSSIWFQPSI
jgi:hypothetical protein